MLEVSRAGDSRLKHWFAIAVAAGACDYAFQLDHVALRDAAGDAACGAFDEDGDCRADDVDNCPGIPNAAQANDLDGGDGLGDICDPEPGMPGDERKLFFGFNDPATDMTLWNVTPASEWSFTPGMLVHDLADSAGYLRHIDLHADTNLTVEAGYTFHAWSTALNTAPRLTVDVDIEPGTVRTHQCWVQLDPGNATRDDAYHQDFTGVHTRAANIPKLVDGDNVVIRFQRQMSPPRMRCRVTINGSGVDVPEIAPAAVTWPTSGLIGVRAREVSADLRYVAVYVGP